jgi:allantoin racemase
LTRLLIVNPNTTTAVTETVVGEARRCARKGTEVVGVTSAFGASIVSTETENLVAGHAALDLLATHHPGFDAAVVAMSFDTGVFAARTLLPIPVIGITEAALHLACLLGRRVGLVVLGAMSLPLYTDLIDRIGLEKRVGAIETVELASAAAYRDRSAMDAEIEAAALRLAARAVDVVVICGAAVAGVASRLKDRLPLPILDGVAPAVAQAESLAALAPKLSRRVVSLAAGEPPTGLGPELTTLLDCHRPPPEHVPTSGDL